MVPLRVSFPHQQHGKYEMERGAVFSGVAAAARGAGNKRHPLHPGRAADDQSRHDRAFMVKSPTLNIAFLASALLHAAAIPVVAKLAPNSSRAEPNIILVDFVAAPPAMEKPKPAAAPAPPPKLAAQPPPPKVEAKAPEPPPP